MYALKVAASQDALQLWSGFLGALLSGLVMVVVLIVTLIVQTKQHRTQLKEQAKQFESQQDANERLLRTQLDLERRDASHREILRVRTKVMIGLLDLERIASTGRDTETYGSRRYEILALNREIKSNLSDERRAEYKRLAELHDRVGVILVERFNNGVPTDDAFSTEYAKLIGLLEEWTDAYVADNDERMQIVNLHVENTHRSLDEAGEFIARGLNPT